QAPRRAADDDVPRFEHRPRGRFHRFGFREGGCGEGYPRRSGRDLSGGPGPAFHGIINLDFRRSGRFPASLIAVGRSPENFRSQKMTKIKIVPSILSADFARLGEDVARAEKAGADHLQIDVMDGHFVPNITVGPMIVEAVRRHTRLPLEVHLMITNPDAYLDEFAAAGADYLIVHQETLPHLHRT